MFHCFLSVTHLSLSLSQLSVERQRRKTECFFGLFLTRNFLSQKNTAAVYFMWKFVGGIIFLGVLWAMSRRKCNSHALQQIKNSIVNFRPCEESSSLGDGLSMAGTVEIECMPAVFWCGNKPVIFLHYSRGVGGLTWDIVPPQLIQSGCQTEYSWCAACESGVDTGGGTGGR